MNGKNADQLLAIFLILVMILSGLFFVNPTRESLSLNKNELTVASENLLELETELNALKEVESKVSDSAGAKSELLALIPVGVNQDKLIVEISDLAEESGLDLNSMSFTDSVDSVSVSANFQGSYAKLVDFLQAVENSSRLMTVSSLNVQLTSTTDMVFNLNIEAYYQ